MESFKIAELFEMELSFLELMLRGSIMYFGILILMRLMPRRTGGELALTDLIFVLIIAEAAAHSLGEYTSVTEGFIVIVTLIAWNYLINWLSFRVPVIEKLVSPPPLQIIKSGKLIRRNMRRELITQDELMESLHKQGIEDISEVKKAYVEGDGRISIIKKR